MATEQRRCAWCGELVLTGTDSRGETVTVDAIPRIGGTVALSDRPGLYRAHYRSCTMVRVTEDDPPEEGEPV